MTTDRHDQPDDERVAAEWTRLEHERVARERAEAGQDAADVGVSAPRKPPGTRLSVVLLVSLAAGLAFAYALTRASRPGAVTQTETSPSPAPPPRSLP